ncbi:MAG: ABC transporter permease [Pseudorhodoplanes sp.]
MSRDLTAMFGLSRDDWSRRLFFFVLVVLVSYIVLAPLLTLFYGSVSTGSPGEPGVFSLDGYRELFLSPRTYQLLFNSVVYATGSTIIAFLIGGLMAWSVQRTDIPGKPLITFLALFPLFMPPVLATIGWNLLLDPNIGLINKIVEAVFGGRAPFDVNTLAGMIWVGGVLEVPLVFLWLWPALAAMDPTLEEAAAMTGATPLRTIRTIVLPLITPALAAAFLINFVLAIEDVTVPIIIGLPAGINVLASEIYIAYIRVPTDFHSTSVHAVFLLFITALLTVGYLRLTRSSERYVTIKGRGYRPSLIALGKVRWPLTILIALLIFFTVILPVFILVWTSLSPYLRTPSIEGLKVLSLEAYRKLLVDDEARRGLVNTAILGIGSAVVVMALAVMISWFQIRSKYRFRKVLDLIAFLPVAIPGLVVGLSLMWLYLTIKVPIYGTLWILGLAFVTRFLPYGVRLTYSGFAQLHHELEEAAQVSKSGWFKALYTISVPLLMPTLMVGIIYLILRAFRELSASLLLTSFGNEPYSVVAYHMWDGGEVGKAAAYGVIAMIVMTTIVLIAQRWVGRNMTSMAES